jgi:hypothetical protein
MFGGLGPVFDARNRMQIVLGPGWRQE